MTKHHAAPLDFSDSGSDKQQMRITHVQLREPSKYRSPPRLTPFSTPWQAAANAQQVFGVISGEIYVLPSSRKLDVHFMKAGILFICSSVAANASISCRSLTKNILSWYFCQATFIFFPNSLFFFFFLSSWGKHSSRTALPLITDKRHPLTHLNTEILLLTSIHYYFQEAGDQVLHRKKDLHNYPSHLRIKYFVLRSGLHAYLWKPTSLSRKTFVWSQLQSVQASRLIRQAISAQNLHTTPERLPQL